jgi:hypothetical protein
MGLCCTRRAGRAPGHLNRRSRGERRLASHRLGETEEMRSRIATIVTMLALVAGTGGAIALGQGGSGGSSQGGAATAQYKPGKGCGDKNHQHKKRNQCKPPKKHKHKKHVKKHKGSYHCKYHQVAQNLVGTCRFY